MCIKRQLCCWDQLSDTDVLCDWRWLKVCMWFLWWWILWMHMKENMFLPLHIGEAGLDEPFPNLRRLYIKCVMTIQMNHYCSLQKTVSMSFMCISMHVLLYIPTGHWLSINFTNNCGPLILERNICWQKATYKISKPSRVKIFILSYFSNRFQCTQEQYLNFFFF